MVRCYYGVVIIFKTITIFGINACDSYFGWRVALEASRMIRELLLFEGKILCRDYKKLNGKKNSCFINADVRLNWLAFMCNLHGNFCHCFYKTIVLFTVR